MLNPSRLLPNPALCLAVFLGVEPPSEPAKQGYLGANVVDNGSGQTVFTWFFPGPLNGASLRSGAFDLQRPDVLIAVDGRPMNAAAFNAYIASRAPRTTVTIEYEPATTRGTANIPASVETTGERRTIAVTLEDRDEWTGTIGRPNTLTDPWRWPAGPPLLDPFDQANVLGEQVAAHGLREDVERLTGVFQQWIDKTTDTHMLPVVRAGFERPFQLAEIQQGLDVRRLIPRTTRAGATASLTADPVQFSRDLLEVLLGMEGVGGSFGLGGEFARPTTAVAAHLRGIVGFSRVWLDMALGKGERTETAALQCIEFLRVPRGTFYIGGEHSKQHIEVIRRSVEVNWKPLANLLSGLTTQFPAEVVALRERPLVDPPAALAGAVEGTIIEAFENRDGWIIVGGPGPNRYDMAKVVAVYDIGGDDVYHATGLRLGTRLIIDLEGNDTYTGTPEQGPGGAIFGLSFIDDRAGNDRYEGQMLSCGAAIYGVSLLLDRAGDDTYIGTDWSMGAAVYGAGMLIDLKGNDSYKGEFLCQGVGGPRGLGALIDVEGDDDYQANGPQPSMYGTPNVYASFSQGVGFGYRNYAAGGVGMLSDLAGNDRYESGEFSQGGAYYFALGVLHDAAGDDVYVGNRYGQGFGVHQAHGILADNGGDDTYTSMTAASQGAAWDIGAGLLIDQGGNDSYTCDGLGQGGASMQGIAMLVDLGGEDRYEARGGATQGESGGDSYHYATTKAFSFSLLLDLGAAVDFYSRNRANDAVTKTGAINEQQPENSSAWGLVIDR